ncbi:DUF84 family protein [Bacillus sp. 31A1R]|uniref:Probable inosine/xanthosine triphosphatase n=1 Tax=Robertmurraya mangrovi TaxID=3098077 RepID=A0ABU5IZH9_9BACI|nr:DUF84 family protein [Bacillus sp. 31A1R]MDZ5472563.1 DUF84 family protein [Bacillus sp. 31A1R]
MKIIIGSKNPAKVHAVKTAFTGENLIFESLNVPSEVSEQPFSDEETIQGAINRANHAINLGNGDIGIGLEGGVHQTKHGLFLCNWGALVTVGMAPIVAGGARILLPEEIAKRLLNGEELGPVMDDYAKKKNVRKNEGAIGIFTNGLVNREEMFNHVSKMLVGQYQYKMNKGE